MKVLTAAALGALFGLGLLLSGMTDPARVLGFLDVTGRWDPSLALVMGGALLVAIPSFTLIRRRRRAVLGDEIADPRGPILDPALLGGSALFGVGWGLAGICPGPSLVLLGQAPAAIGVFVLAAGAGSILASAALHRLGGPAEQAWET